MLYVNIGSAVTSAGPDDSQTRSTPTPLTCALTWVHICDNGTERLETRERGRESEREREREREREHHSKDGPILGLRNFEVP